MYGRVIFSLIANSVTSFADQVVWPDPKLELETFI